MQQANSVYHNVDLLQLLDTINQLQQVKTLQDRKSAPTTSAEPVAPQTTATVIESLTKPSPNCSSTPDKCPSLQLSSTDHLTDEMVNAASGSSDDNVMSGTDPTDTLVERNVEQVSNVIPSTAERSVWINQCTHVLFLNKIMSVISYHEFIARKFVNFCSKEIFGCCIHSLQVT